MQDVIEFLRQLRLHNDRTWFEANKSWYRDAQSQFAAFVEELIAGIADSIPPCKGSPQKIVPTGFIATHASAPTRPLTRPTWEHTFAGEAKSPGFAGYYFHVEPQSDAPGGHLLSAGIYMPDRDVLESIREEILDNGAAFEASVKRARGFRLYQGNKLKKFPAGFTAEGTYSDYLKLKDFYLEKFVDEDYMLQPDLAREGGGRLQENLRLQRTTEPGRGLCLRKPVGESRLRKTR